MAHVHGAASAAADASKHAAQAAHHSTQAAQAMVERSTHLAQAAHHHAAAGHSMITQAAPAAVSFHNVAKGAAATGVVATAGVASGKSWLGKLLSHPVVLFGLGVAVGYTVHKYRKEIIQSANRTAEKSKDFILQQRENLEDIVAEGQAPDNA
ncbi:MAG: hypothetical protein ACOYMG_19245 [Candidatus Methylumidiphilus sp.]